MISVEPRSRADALRAPLTAAFAARAVSRFEPTGRYHPSRFHVSEAILDLVAFFLSQHAALHASDVGGRAFAAQSVFSELSDDQMRIRPGQRLNSLVWLLWHMARTEDVAVNLVVAGRDQILDEAWMRRMNVPWRIIRTGMTDDEVTEMTARAYGPIARRWESAHVRSSKPCGLTRGMRSSLTRTSSAPRRPARSVIGEAITVRGLGGFGLGI